MAGDPESIVRAVCEAYSSGVPVLEIREIFQVSLHRLYKIIRMSGINLRETQSRDQLVSLANSGISQSEIASHLGVSRQNISARMKRYGVVIQPKPHPNCMLRANRMSWDDDEVFVLVSLMEQGLKFREIGERIGCSKNAAIGKARTLGIRKKEKDMTNG